MKTLDDFINFCRKCIVTRQGFLEKAMSEDIKVTEYIEHDHGNGMVDITDDYIERFQAEIKTFEELISDLKDATS